MKNNNKWLLGGLIGFTVILLATALVLFFQLKQPSPSPSPKAKPAASPALPPIQETTAIEVCSVSFTVAASPSPSPSPGVSPSPSPSPAPTACFDTCGSDADCEDDLRCLTVSGTKRCVNAGCTEDADCTCAEAKKTCWDKCQNDNDCESKWSCETIPGTNDKRCVNSACISESDCSCAVAKASPNAPASPQPQAQLPQAGVSLPMVLGVSTGILMMILGLFAL